MIIITFLCGIFIGGLLGYYFFYSPKAMVKKLSREVLKISQLKVDSTKDSVMAYIVNNGPDEVIEKRKRTINAFLDCLNPDTEKEFIEKYRP